MNGVILREIIKLTLILISGLLFSIGLGKELDIPYLASNLYLIPLALIGLIASIVLIYRWKNKNQDIRLFFYLAVLSALCFILYSQNSMPQLIDIFWRNGIYNGVMSFVLLLSALKPKILDAIIDGFVFECLTGF